MFTELLAGTSVLAAATTAFILHRGSEHLVVDLNNRTKLQRSNHSNGSFTLFTTFDVLNIGKQSLIINDAFPRVFLPREFFNHPFSVNLFPTNLPRDDHYFEALVIEHADKRNFTLAITTASFPPPFHTTLHFQFVGRNPLRFTSAHTYFNPTELSEVSHA